MAAVTFSGFNNIDFNQVVTAIMEQERQPLTTLQTRHSTLDTQKTAFGTLAGRLTAVQSALETLASKEGVTALKASSSDTGVGVASTGGSIEGSYDVVVTAIARRQVTASASTYASADTVISTGGALTLTGADGSTTTISVDAMMTVKELVEAINSAHDAPVTASLVQSTPGAYQIVLTGRHSGTAGAFTVSGAISGSNVQEARNAELTVNGLAIVSESNTLTDVIPGVTMTLVKEDPDTTVAVNVTRDTDSAKERVQKLVTAYNDLVGFISDQRTALTNGKANIARDPVVQGLHNSLRAALLAPYDNDGGFSRLAEVGIGFDQAGKMVIHTGTLENAVTRDVSSVQALFSGDDGKSGAFGAIGKLIKDYTKSGGLVAEGRDRLSTQMQSLTGRIDALNEQLERRRLTLQKEFQAADEAMSRLNSQMASLSSLGSQYRLF